MHATDIHSRSQRGRFFLALFVCIMESSRTVPAGLQSGALPTADLSAAAADYLRRCGMTQDQIDQLVDLLTGE